MIDARLTEACDVSTQQQQGHGVGVPCSSGSRIFAFQMGMFGSVKVSRVRLCAFRVVSECYFFLATTAGLEYTGPTAAGNAPHASMCERSAPPKRARPERST